MNPALDNNGFVSGPAQNGPNSFGNLIQRFNDFKRTFSGDPKATVENLLSSGRMTQQQYDQLSQMARNLQNVLH